MNSPWPADFEALARQYWTAWNQMLGTQPRPAWPGFAGMAGMPGMGLGAAPFGMPTGGSAVGTMPGMMPGMGGMPGGWQDMLQGWARMAMGGADGGMRNVLDRLGSQAGGWWTQMQELSARLAEQNANAAEVAAEWRQMLEAQGSQAVFDMFRGIQGADSYGFEAWYQSAKPYLELWRREAQSLLGLPAFGLLREHQERIQGLLQAQVDYQDRLGDYNAMLLKVSQDAIGIFEDLLRKHEEPGKQVKTARALFDLWIDAAEQAYANVALSTEFRAVYGEMVNAQMRLRSHVQREVEQMCGMFGMPTRTEIDAAHRKIADLERQLRRLRDREDEEASADDADSSAGTGRWAEMMAATRATSAPRARAKPTKQASKAKPAAAKATVKKAAKRAATAKSTRKR